MFDCRIIYYYCGYVEATGVTFSDNGNSIRRKALEFLVPSSKMLFLIKSFIILQCHPRYGAREFNLLSRTHLEGAKGGSKMLTLLLNTCTQRSRESQFRCLLYEF
jgi:hypothetical protein